MNATKFSSFDGRCQLTRAEVADLANLAVAEVTNRNVAHFSPNDERLTEAACTLFCNAMADYEDITRATQVMIDTCID